MAQSDPPPTPIQQELAKKREYLSSNEAAYLRAKDYLKGEQYLKDQVAALRKIKVAIKEHFLPETEANFILGRVCQIVEDLDAAPQLIREYESTRQSIADYLARTA